jgi:hypothetical protein
MNVQRLIEMPIQSVDLLIDVVAHGIRYIDMMTA